MAFEDLLIIAAFTAIAFLIQFGLRHEKTPLLSMFSESLMFGIMGMGILAYVLAPSPITGVVLLPVFSPHAYNLIIWPLGALLILREKFGARLLIPAFAMGYGLDEVIWNAVAYVRFQGDPVILLFMTHTTWQVFFLSMIGGFIIGFLIVKPAVRVSVSLLILPVFMVVWAWGAGFPVGAVTPYGLAFELMYQLVYWFFIATTFFRKVEPAITSLEEMVVLS